MEPSETNRDSRDRFDRLEKETVPLIRLEIGLLLPQRMVIMGGVSEAVNDLPETARSRVEEAFKAAMWALKEELTRHGDCSVEEWFDSTGFSNNGELAPPLFVEYEAKKQENWFDLNTEIDV